MHCIDAYTAAAEDSNRITRAHLPGLVDEGYLSREVMDAFFVDWDERSREPDGVFFGSPMMEVVGRRS